jgi:DnaD/phage-associated family protein
MKKKFSGFPPGMGFSALPNIFYSAILPYITDLNELKLTLYLFKELLPKRGHLRYVSLGELRGNISLRKSLTGEIPFETALADALAIAVERGVLLELAATRDGAAEKLYFLNDEPGRRAIEKLKSGELEPGGLKAAQPPVETTEPADIFRLYEDNIGMLNPIIADQLKQAERDFPTTWIKEAIEEAVLNRKTSWRYIVRILERWSQEGKSGTNRRDSAQETGTGKYFAGKYGHMVRR